MGGRGSGMGIRFNTHRTKSFVHEYQSINARRMFSYKIMRKIPQTGISIDLHGIHTVIKPDYFEIHHPYRELGKCLRIEFVKTKAHFGNLRYWMRCPNPKCHKCSGCLYLQKLSNGMPIFLCRKCLNLAYKSQNQTKLYRMIATKWAVIEKFKSECSYFWNKPKGMHRKTYDRLMIKLLHLEQDIDSAAREKFGPVIEPFLGEWALPLYAYLPASTYN